MRSGIEIAMHAEAERPVVWVSHRDPARGNRSGQSKRNTYETSRRRSTLQLRIQHVHAHVEVLRDVPLGARTEPPSLPVIVTPGRGYGIGSARTSAEAFAKAKVRIGLRAVSYRCIPAV